MSKHKFPKSAADQTFSGYAYVIYEGGDENTPDSAVAICTSRKKAKRMWAKRKAESKYPDMYGGYIQRIILDQD